MSDFLNRLQRMPGPILGLAAGAAIGLVTGSILLWVPVGFVGGFLWDRKYRGARRA